LAWQMSFASRDTDLGINSSLSSKLLVECHHSRIWHPRPLPLDKPEGRFPFLSFDKTLIWKIWERYINNCREDYDSRVVIKKEMKLIFVYIIGIYVSSPRRTIRGVHVIVLQFNVFVNSICLQGYLLFLWQEHPSGVIRRLYFGFFEAVNVRKWVHIFNLVIVDRRDNNPWSQSFRHRSPWHLFG
jgi:hypothetical protein